MIRQQAFTGGGRLLKGGLHFHSTRSDGTAEPAELIRYCHDHGYNFLALTDHRIYNFKNFAPDVPITIIPAMEFDNTFEKGNGFRTYHVICMGPDDRSNGYRQDETLPTGTAKTQEEFQKFLDDAHSKNNLTVYCHPEWSSTPVKYFEKLKGNAAMEIWNSACAVHTGNDAHASYWDDLLEQGIRIYGVASDDAHYLSDCCVGWINVNAENSVPAILEAIKNGAFYSSTGPEIYDFYIDGDTVAVSCSPAESVRLVRSMHPGHMQRAEWEPITRCEFKLPPGAGFSYIRAEVTDKNGKTAWTNPIFTD